MPDSSSECGESDAAEVCRVDVDIEAPPGLSSAKIQYERLTGAQVPVEYRVADPYPDFSLACRTCGREFVPSKTAVGQTVEDAKLTTFRVSHVPMPWAKRSASLIACLVDPAMCLAFSFFKRPPSGGLEVLYYFLVADTMDRR